MKKKEYMKPSLKVVQLQHRQRVICASQYGMNTLPQSEEVGSAWSRGYSGWDDDEE